MATQDISLEEKIGAMIMVGFEGKTSADLWPELCGQIRKGQVAGVILYARNIEGADQLRALSAELRRLASPRPLFIAVDQEGGKVQRLHPSKGFPDFLSARTAGTKTVEEAKAHYREMAKTIRRAGFNLDFAPVVDLDYGCPVISGLERSYSRDPGKVVRYAKAMIGALREEGLLSCVKHFPGHGGLKEDTHEGLGDGTRAWRKEELIPFYETLGPDGADMVMTAHLMNTTMDKKYPATLSAKILKTLLRDEGFKDVVVISDDLQMGAILKNYGFKEAVVSAVEAGVDILLFSNNSAAAKGVEDFRPDPDLPLKVLDTLRDAAAKKKIIGERIDEAFRRVERLRRRLG